MNGLIILLILFQIIQEIKKKHVGIPGEGEYWLFLHFNV